MITLAPPRIRMWDPHNLRCGSKSKQFQFERVEVFLSPSVRAMLQKECCEAANVRVVKRALFITRNSLKSHEERNLLSPVSNTRAITPKLYTYSNPRFFENSRLRIEITRSPSSIAHAAPSDVSLPAVSSFGGLRTPAPVYVASSSWAGIRKPSHKQTFSGSFGMS